MGAGIMKLEIEMPVTEMDRMEPTVEGEKLNEKDTGEGSLGVFCTDNNEKSHEARILIELTPILELETNADAFLRVPLKKGTKIPEFDADITFPIKFNATAGMLRSSAWLAEGLETPDMENEISSISGNV
jgi:hypothetical protein